MRTWKDAACEIAWNKIKQGENALYMEEFLKGDSNCIAIYSGPKETFPGFKIAFMKWFEKNPKKYEVK